MTVHQKWLLGLELAGYSVMAGFNLGIRVIVTQVVQVVMADFQVVTAGFQVVMASLDLGIRVAATHAVQEVVAGLDLGMRVVATHYFQVVMAGLDLGIRLEQEHPMGRCCLFYYCRQHVLTNLVREI